MHQTFSLVLGLSLLIMACSKSEPPATSATASSGATSPITTPSIASHPANPSVGDHAPSLSMELQDGRSIQLSSFTGKWVAVYFYPKDNTPGCTTEARGLRDQWEELQKSGIEVIGVSTQDAASHKAFIEQEKLPFPLAVDTDGKIASAFGVPVRLGLAARQTFLIGKDGKIQKIWRDVTPKEHASEILAAVR